MTSLSTRFLGQPRLTKPTFKVCVPVKGTLYRIASTGSLLFADAALMLRSQQVDPELRRIVRFSIWIVLGLCFLLDGALGEYAITGGSRDVVYPDDQGQFPPPAAVPWIPIAIFVLVQGILVFAQIRLRKPKDSPASLIRPTG